MNIYIYRSSSSSSSLGPVSIIAPDAPQPQAYCAIHLLLLNSSIFHECTMQVVYRITCRGRQSFLPLLHNKVKL
jgi:hypothetical protein